MPCLPVPICIRRRLPVENFPQHKSRGKSALLQKRKQLTSEKSIFTSKDKPCILKKRLNGVFDQNIGLIIQRFHIFFETSVLLVGQPRIASRMGSLCFLS